MDQPPVQRSSADLRVRLRELREARLQRHDSRREGRAKRRALSPRERKVVLGKTAHRCHIYGGKIVSKWQADHVLAHASGGDNSAENDLPAHVLCNNYRWDYDSEEFQWILKIGVWARTQMAQATSRGDVILTGFASYDSKRHDRRRSP